MSRSDNKLSIRTHGLNLDLEGEAADVRRAYRALRSQLIEQFYQTMIERRGPNDRTLELPVIDDGLGESTVVDEDESDENFINLVVCEDIYNKMYLLDEQRFSESFLSRFLRGSELRRIYVDADLEEGLRDRVDVGSTLWRELTAAGKAAVGRSD
ncbi:hypothetical protein FIV42_22380 [Persicimonas caeni]|uniref:Uncharacterized protein n=1 Tax=Persicimonas caeni TaxID=2292766 RepID=A0A4Y6PYS5_PERCE|nr:hypothetical protein [Persicimonas caeni]QDG53390.1 hypothetical protein FIV42_22380 [Persicimonas caeni]QED34611.1 hypothetical protein FRD00_22375 [Persicimonas caeni]